MPDADRTLHFLDRHFGTIFVVYVLLLIAAVLAIIFVIWHFLSKVW